MTRFDFATTVDLPHPPRVVFRYLAEPRNRPEWQSSLLSVRLEDRDGLPEVGLRWSETTVVGLKPDLEITALEPFRRYEEVGRWRGVTGLLDLRFVAVSAGSRLSVAGHVTGSGVWTAAARSTAALAARVLGSDLRRAGRILTDRGLR